MDSRRALILCAVPAGLAVGAAAWLVAPSRGVASAIARLDGRITAVSAHPPSARLQAAGGVVSAATPLFALTTGQGAVAEVSVKLEGVARSPVRAAALVSINGGPADWLNVGDSREGVTLQDVAIGKAVFDTPTGMQTLAVGESAGGAVAQAAAGSTIPPGFHQPPPPASAPSKP